MGVEKSREHRATHVPMGYRGKDQRLDTQDNKGGWRGNRGGRGKDVSPPEKKRGKDRRSGKQKTVHLGPAISTKTRYDDRGR